MFLFSSSGAASRARAVSDCAHSTMIESLESRQLLSASTLDLEPPTGLPAARIMVVDAMAVEPTNASTDRVNSGMVVVARTGDVSEAARIGIDADGSAVIGEDYTIEGLQAGAVPTAGYAEFEAGQRFVQFQVVPLGDNVTEGNERVVFSLTGSSNDDVEATTDDGERRRPPIAEPMVTIAEQLVRVRTVDRVASEAGASTAQPNLGVFRIAREGDISEPLTVVLNVGGTADQGTDYELLVRNSTGTALVDEVTIPAGERGVEVVVRAAEDNERERRESVILGIAQSDDYAVERRFSRAGVVIVDSTRRDPRPDPRPEPGDREPGEREPGERRGLIRDFFGRS